jgi:hypothetical protein
MKLFEVIVDLDAIQDPMQGRDNQDSNESPIDKRHVDAERKPQSPRRNSNIGRAKRIANKVKMHKRQSNPVGDETHHQSNLGGHGSSFLFR